MTRRDGNAPVLRVATAEDVPGIERCVNAAYAPHAARMGTRPGPMLDDYPRVVATCPAWVAMEGSEVVGVVILKAMDTEPLLDNVAVHPDWQGSGLGRRLIAHAEALVRDAGHTTIRLYTHESMVENIALYARLGYTESRRVTEQGFARVYMHKRLA